MPNRIIETYDTEENVLQKIEELKKDGYLEKDMYIMAKSDNQLSLVRGKSDVEAHASEGGWADRFATFLTGDQKVHQAFSDMGIDENESEHYYRDVQNGKLLLFVDTDAQDAFELPENEKTAIQEDKLESEGPRVIEEEREEKAVELDDRHYEDPAFRKDKRNADPISKPDEKNFI
ncbi:general stress protein [Microbacterium sp. APC 3898]|uniref:General stress protein n=2 Tax=Planococcus TaxID=1372 RepID=A0ABT7ZM39_9BACL|nr:MULTISPECIES: general stress protein [Terrabacteria group]MBD8014836.1 general stress protein [Planococcus wigleyi]MDN3427722.1 general stress protein [Planococcus sp. APC 4016]MDN3499274.1 general stress protein [Microbacterium sp. APC 3898]